MVKLPNIKDKNQLQFGAKGIGPDYQQERQINN